MQKSLLRDTGSLSWQGPTLFIGSPLTLLLGVTSWPETFHGSRLPLKLRCVKGKALCDLSVEGLSNLITTTQVVPATHRLTESFTLPFLPAEQPALEVTAGQASVLVLHISSASLPTAHWGTAGR